MCVNTCWNGGSYKRGRGINLGLDTTETQTIFTWRTCIKSTEIHKLASAAMATELVIVSWVNGVIPHLLPDDWTLELNKRGARRRVLTHIINGGGRITLYKRSSFQDDVGGSVWKSSCFYSLQGFSLSKNILDSTWGVFLFLPKWFQLA